MRLDALGEGPRRAAAANKAHVGKHEPEPEPQQGIVNAEAHPLGIGPLAVQRVAAAQVAKARQLLKIVMQVPLRQPGGGGNGRGGAFARGNREQHRLVGRNFAQLLAQQKGRFMEQRRELVEQALADVLFDGPDIVQAKQVLGQAADQKVGFRLIGGRPARMEFGGLQIAERPQLNLRRAPPEQGAGAAEHFTLHKAQIRAAQQQHEVAGVLPMPVPAFLQGRWQVGACRCGPLKFVQGEDELFSGMGQPPLLDHGEQGAAPIVHAQFRKQGHGQRPGRFNEKFAHLQRHGGPLPQMIDARLAVHEPQYEFALADASPAVNGNEL